jgi:hypothetical protein
VFGAIKFARPRSGIEVSVGMFLKDLTSA